MTNVFSAEHDKLKREALMAANPDVQFVFNSVTDLALESFTCCKTGLQVNLSQLSIDILIAGISCKDFSGMNPIRAIFFNCLAENYDGQGPIHGILARGMIS